MRDPDRIPAIIRDIESIWKEHPGLRLIQLLMSPEVGDRLLYVEDEELVRLLREKLEPELLEQIKRDKRKSKVREGERS